MATQAQPEFLEATYGSVCRSTRCDEKRRRTLESVVHLAVELAREGREGRKIGTLFVIGDVDNVLAQSRSLLLDPLYGQSEDLLHVERPEFRETVKELSQLDGAFVVRDDGTFVSVGRYVDVVVVSQSSVVRVFANGQVRAEIIPELFLMSKEGLFASAADVRQVPEAGVTLAVAD